MAQTKPMVFDDNLSDRLRSFHLTEEEQSEIALLSEDVKASKEECRTSIFGKIISQKAVNFSGLRSTMEMVWGYPKNFRVLEIGNGIYQFILPSETAVIRILNGKPWYFNNNFLVLERWNPNIQPHLYKFNLTPIWIRIWGLPIQCVSKEVGLKLGSRIGYADDVAIPVTGSKNGRFVRVRVHMDVTLPLKRGCLVKLGTIKPFGVEFRYERLPNFCRYCGMPGRRKSPPPLASLRPVEDPNREGSVNSGVIADNHPNPSISEHSTKEGKKDNLLSNSVDLAHEEMLTEFRNPEKYPDLARSHTPFDPLKDITPAQEKALQIWQAKNSKTTTTLSPTSLAQNLLPEISPPFPQPVSFITQSPFHTSITFGSPLTPSIILSTSPLLPNSQPKSSNLKAPFPQLSYNPVHPLTLPASGQSVQPLNTTDETISLSSTLKSSTDIDLVDALVSELNPKRKYTRRCNKENNPKSQTLSKPNPYVSKSKKPVNASKRARLSRNSYQTW
ncbi:hypothetical protein Vadar_009169 [Vaccinium darrowii]|uniref:Uncharacterized protein n=1 Tax=Vaccinium darrowii TaxID=229202 RepID=A0ACB7YCK1_9ERIC|nr:hypothetical protein Vadar_009169 [Vaccinium darrowii]